MDQSHQDRLDSGRRLGSLLKHELGAETLVVATLGGASVVAAQVAGALSAELDVILVRSIDVPLQEELSLGAVVSGGNVVLRREVIDALRIDAALLRELAYQELAALIRAERAHRGDKPPLNVSGRRVLLVDDGLTSRQRLIEILTALRAAAPGHLMTAAPLVTPECWSVMLRHSDRAVCIAPVRASAEAERWDEQARAPASTDARSLSGGASRG